MGLVRFCSCSTQTLARAQELWCTGLFGPRACVIFPDQGSNLCPLHWQADAQLLDHQGSPRSNCIFDLRLLGSSLYWYKSPLGCWGRPVRGCGRFQGGGIIGWDPFARARAHTHTQSGTEIYTRQNFIDVGLPGEGVCGPQGRACSTIMGVAWMTGSPWGR